MLDTQGEPMTDQIDLMTATLTEDIIHPETREVVAPAGATFMDALPALVDVGADHIETSIGVITISGEVYQ
jgi:hypothetical protein